MIRSRKRTLTIAMSTAWFALLLAGLLEVMWVLCMKYSDGLTRFWPTVAAAVAILLSFAMMAISLRQVPFGTAYALWTGMGAAGSIVAGILLFQESADLIRLSCLALIIAGMVGLKLATPE
jgi:quaternary ammonium compound-resistance protein SugE